jgi:hypothetical protein
MAMEEGRPDAPAGAIEAMITWLLASVGSGFHIEKAITKTAQPSTMTPASLIKRRFAKRIKREKKFL